MSGSFDLAAAHAAVGLCLLALAGLAIQGHARTCPTFFGYLIALLVGDSLRLFAPQWFWTREFWQLETTSLALLMFGVGVETTLIVSRPLRAPRAAAIGAIGTAVLAMTMTTALCSGPLWAARERLDLGNGLLFTAVAALSVRRAWTWAALREPTRVGPA